MHHLYQRRGELADERVIYVRSGELCNPGGIAKHLDSKPGMTRLWPYGHRGRGAHKEEQKS